MALTVPVSALLALLSVTLPPVESSVEVPVTLKGPVCVMSPTPVALRLPVTVVVPNTVPPLLVVFRLPVLPLTVKVPGVPVVVKVLVPVAFSTAVSGTLSFNVTLLPVALTVPTKALAGSLRVMLPLVEVICVVPSTVKGPVWLMSEPAFKVKLPAMVEGD